MRSEEEKKEQRKKAQKKYYEKNKEYYRKQSIEEIKEITNKMIKTSQPNGVFLTAKTRDKIIYYINNSLEEIEKLNNIINEVSKELKEFNESYLEDEGDTGVYRYLNKLIEKLNEGKE